MFYGRERGNMTCAFAFQLTVDLPNALDFLLSYAFYIPNYSLTINNDVTVLTLQQAAARAFSVFE